MNQLRVCNEYVDGLDDIRRLGSCCALFTVFKRPEKIWTLAHLNIFYLIFFVRFFWGESNAYRQCYLSINSSTHLGHRPDLCTHPDLDCHHRDDLQAHGTLAHVRCIWCLDHNPLVFRPFAVACLVSGYFLLLAQHPFSSILFSLSGIPYASTTLEQSRRTRGATFPAKWSASRLSLSRRERYAPQTSQTCNFDCAPLGSWFVRSSLCIGCQNMSKEGRNLFLLLIIMKEIHLVELL